MTRIYNGRGNCCMERYMKTFAFVWLLGTLLGSTTAVAQQAVPTPAPIGARPAYMTEPGWLGQAYFGAAEYGKLEAVVQEYIKLKTRTEDGRFALFMLTWRLSDWLELWDEDQDSVMTAKLAEWREQFPRSALEPIVAAMQVHATAWRARGRGFSSTVTDEGWKLFAERNQRAWRILMDNKKDSSALPTWYEQAIGIGNDANIPDQALRKLFDEGVRRYPGYHPLYFAYARHLSPRWGGNYADADAFIREQVTAKTNPEGEILYARLYWVIDQYDGASPSFFDDSLVSWPRMRGGFERMMREYPKSKWNQASFAVFACRARDATTYGVLRPKVDAEQFKMAAPEGISLEVCDARFLTKV
jgi:hypothetical protein